MNYCILCFRDATYYGKFFAAVEGHAIYEFIHCDGHYSIVDGHDEIFRFTEKPLKDPCWEIETETTIIEDLFKDPEFRRKEDEYSEAVERFRKDFVFHPQTGHALYMSALHSGWEPERHGWLEYWMFDHAAKLIEQHDTLSRTA
jgi:hypothetical protein